jgi:hypothetical protein
MDHKEVVDKLIGEITPIGESNHDKKAFNCLITHALLTEAMVNELIGIAQLEQSYKHSIMRAGEYAKHRLKDLQRSLNQIFDEE